MRVRHEDAKKAGGIRRVAVLAPVLLGLVGGAGSAPAEFLEAAVQDDAGAPLADAVVYAHRLDRNVASAPAEPAIVDQIDKEYVPYVTPVQTGASVLFPNHDQIRHHVYSFSEAKTFEIPLYKGVPAEPVLFDEPGEVALGCNIHDWMRAYVYVVDTPHFAVTDEDGRASLSLEAGEYRVEVWHPELAVPAAETAQRVLVSPGDGAAPFFRIERKRVWRPRRAPSRSDLDY